MYVARQLLYDANMTSGGEFSWFRLFLEMTESIEIPLVPPNLHRVTINDALSFDEPLHIACRRTDGVVRKT